MSNQRADEGWIVLQRAHLTVPLVSPHQGHILTFLHAFRMAAKLLWRWARSNLVLDMRLRGADLNNSATFLLKVSQGDNML